MEEKEKMRMKWRWKRGMRKKYQRGEMGQMEGEKSGKKGVKGRGKEVDEVGREE